MGIVLNKKFLWSQVLWKWNLADKIEELWHTTTHEERELERELVPTDIKFGNLEISIFHERKHHFHSTWVKMLFLNSEYLFGVSVWCCICCFDLFFVHNPYNGCSIITLNAVILVHSNAMHFYRPAEQKKWHSHRLGWAPNKVYINIALYTFSRGTEAWRTKYGYRFIDFAMKSSNLIVGILAKVAGTSRKKPLPRMDLVCLLFYCCSLKE